MNEIVKKEDVITPIGDPIMQIIERAATNPDVDIDKMERLLQMQERILDRNAEADFAASMTIVQSLLPAVAKDAANNQTNSSYSRHETIAKAIKPIYTQEGFSITFSEGDSTKENHIRVIGILRHRSGHVEQHHLDIPFDNAGIKGTVNKTNTHAAGSTYSYGRRYLTCMMFDVATGDDDDGQAAGTRYISGKAVTELKTRLEAVQADMAGFLGYMGVPTLEDISESDYPKALNAVRAKEKKNAS